MYQSTPKGTPQKYNRTPISILECVFSFVLESNGNWNWKSTHMQKYAFSLSPKTPRSISVHITVHIAAFLPATCTKTFENARAARWDVTWTLLRKILQTPAPATFLVIVFILMDPDVFLTVFDRPHYYDMSCVSVFVLIYSVPKRINIDPFLIILRTY